MNRVYEERSNEKTMIIFLHKQIKNNQTLQEYEFAIFTVFVEKIKIEIKKI